MSQFRAWPGKIMKRVRMDLSCFGDSFGTEKKSWFPFSSLPQC